MKRMRLRNSAALYSGKIKGPKHSKNPGREDAGWKGVKAGLNVSKTIASLKVRLRLSGPSPGRNRKLKGESMGESTAADSEPPILKASQYSDNGCKSVMSAAYFLSNAIGD